MFYEEYGNIHNPTILFLHGAMAFSSLYRQQELQDKFHLVFYTLPGHGLDSERNFCRETAIAEAVSIAKSLNKSKIYLLGFSLGAQLALKLLNDYSNLFEKVVLISPLIDSNEIDNQLLSLSTRIVGFSTKFTPFTKLASLVIGINDDEFVKFKREQKSQKVNILAADILKDMLKSKDLHNIKTVKNKVLILTGEMEQLSFKRSAIKLNDLIQNSKLQFYSTAGHNIPYKFYKRFNEQVREFFAS